MCSEAPLLKTRDTCSRKSWSNIYISFSIKSARLSSNGVSQRANEFLKINKEEKRVASFQDNLCWTGRAGILLWTTTCGEWWRLRANGVIRRDVRCPGPVRVCKGAAGMRKKENGRTQHGQHQWSRSVHWNVCAAALQY